MIGVLRRHSSRRAVGSIVARIVARIAAIEHVPGVATGTAGVVGLALLWLAPLGGWVTATTVTTDAAPLLVAEGPSAHVVGYLGAGTTRVYVPATAVVAVLAGEVAAARGDAVGYLAGVLLGLAGAGSLVVLSACGCGTGSTTYLFEAAVGVP